MNGIIQVEEILTEDTRLRREIKKLMLNNTYIHWTNAIIPEEM